MTGGRGRGRGRSAGNQGGKSGTQKRHTNKRGRNRPVSNKQEDELLEEVTNKLAVLDINADVQSFFLTVVSFENHRRAQEENRTRYAAAMMVLIRQGVTLSPSSKVRALAAAWSRQDYDLADGMLAVRDIFGLVEVSKALQLLDAGRQIRSLEKRLKKMKEQAEKANHTLRPGTIKTIEKKIANLTAIKPEIGSVSGALCKHIASWVRKFLKTELEFFALHYPKEPWKYLSDICHFHPEKDFPELPWFLPFCYDTGKPPDSSMVGEAKNITALNINDVLQRQFIPFTHLRQFSSSLNENSKKLIVEGEDKVDRAIWWYEELSCPAVDEMILARLKNGEAISLNYGKLMERMLKLKLMDNKCPEFYHMMIPTCNNKLSKINLKLENPVAVIADASGSMEVAINTATIISSILTACTTAKLVFFNSKFWFPETSPKTTNDVLHLATSTKADNCTAHAAGLWPFYEKQEVIKTFIIVTDEEENASYKEHRFQDLFKLYQDKVYNARLVFISFLSRQTSEGQMCKSLREDNTINLVQFKMDRSRPDLTRLDNILGQLSLGSDSFVEILRQQVNDVERYGVMEGFKKVSGDYSETLLSTTIS